MQTRLFRFKPDRLAHRARLLLVSALAPAPRASQFEPPLPFRPCRLVRRSYALVRLYLLGPDYSQPDPMTVFEVSSSFSPYLKSDIIR
jgi:hypothetical protein